SFQGWRRFVKFRLGQCLEMRAHANRHAGSTTQDLRGAMSLSFDRSAALIAEAAQHVAGGVNSNFRIGMAGGPLVFRRGEGPYLLDVNGNWLIDYYCGMGAMILGHSPKTVQQ